MGTPTQPDLAQIRAELRQMISSAVGADLDDIDDETPLLDYVTSSLVLLAGIRAIYDRFGVLIPLRPLLEGAGNLRALAAFIEQALNGQGGNGRPASARKASDRSKEPRIPLTAAQHHIGFLARYSAGSSAAFNESAAVRLTGPLHGPALQAAIEVVVERHEALRAVLLDDTDALTLSSDRFELPISHCSQDGLAARAAETAGRPFSAEEPLFRAELLRAGEADHVLVLAGHALVLDHAALLAVLDEIAESYGAYARGEDPPRGQPASQLTAAMAEAADDASRSAAEAYWTSVFADGVHRLELPTDYRRPPVKSYDGASVAVPLPTEVAAALKAQPQPAEVVFSAFTLLLHRLAGQKDFVVGLPANRRRHTEGRPEVGTPGTILPIRSHYDGGLGFAAHVAATAERLADANRHHHLGLTDIIRILKIARDQSRPPLFSAAFRLEAYDQQAQFHLGLRTSVVPAPVPRARYDLELILTASPDSTEVRFAYSTELFDEATIVRWAQGFLELLRAGLDDPSRPCALLPVMSEQERRRVLYDWNATEVAYPRDRTALDLIAERALATPDRQAIRGAEGELTYAELMARCGAIAAMLHHSGVMAGDRVAILLPRTPDLVAAMLAIWHLGAAYLPLDPDTPAKRKAFMLADAAARVVVTTRGLAGLVEGAVGVRPLCIDAQETVRPAPMRALGIAGDAAYVLYTSGSTGQPKGVEVTHRSLLNLLLGARRRLGFSESSSLLAVTTASFDISLPELFVPLLAGGLLQLGEEGLAADGIRLAERIEQCKPSYVQATPSTWKLVVAAGWTGSKQLCVGATGEALPRELAEQLILRAGEVWNLYGPTEATVWSAAHRVTSAPGEPVRIGRPWDNAQLHVLDEQMQPVPIAAVGELYIGGEGLARGYVGRPELTSERFVASPFSAGERLYRTGDLARRLPDGDIICLGRLDHQVKIHGYRVELEEIESSLRRVPGIRDAVVATWTDSAGDRQLVAHVITDDPALTPAVIRGHLRQTLPEPMIPTHVRFTDRFPLMTSGKVNRAALPAADALQSTRRVVTPPDTPTERKAAEIWARVLRVGASQVSRDDDFMDLGGHSLKMTQLMVEVRKAFGVHFSMRDFFAASTLRTFAALVDELKRAPADVASRYVAMHARDSEWGRQRMLFLRREAELPPALAPTRGLTYQARELRNVLLTGATGFLGAYMVAEILRSTDARLHCLVRSKPGAGSKARIEAQLRAYELWGGDGAWDEAWDTRVHIVAGDVILPRLGIADAAYEGLAREIDAIIHSAAHVNFIYPYEALKATNVLGLHEIVRFAFHARIKPVHYLSTAAIWPMGAEYTFYEADHLDHGKLLNLGYDEAKWVGERCLVNAADRGLPVARYRPGEVGGDSHTGRAVLNHFLVAAFKGFLQFGALPPVDTHLDVAPVDYVAKAIVHMAFNGNPLGRAFHLTNPRACHMRDALTFLRTAGYRFQEMPFDELRRKLVEDPGFADNALFPYQAALESMDDRSLQLPRYDCRQTQHELAASGIACPPVDEQLLGTYLRHLRGVGFIPDPDQLPGCPPDPMHVAGSATRTRVASTHHATA